MATVTDASTKNAAMYYLARKIASGELGPSASSQEIDIRASELNAKGIGYLYDLFLRESRAQGKQLFTETLNEDFADWFAAEQKKEQEKLRTA